MILVTTSEFADTCLKCQKGQVKFSVDVSSDARTADMALFEDCADCGTTHVLTVGEREGAGVRATLGLGTRPQR